MIVLETALRVGAVKSHDKLLKGMRKNLDGL